MVTLYCSGQSCPVLALYLWDRPLIISNFGALLGIMQEFFLHKIARLCSIPGHGKEVNGSFEIIIKCVSLVLCTRLFQERID